MSELVRICVTGLGYVGLPLAIGLSRSFPVVGLDSSARRVEELRAGIDRNREVSPEQLRASTIEFVSENSRISGCDVFIITVPTPVDADNRPDLTAVRAACRAVGAVLRKGNIVVLESTVYPGVTEDICGPELEKASKLRSGTDFFLGYSPERINPGDREHTVERITKVVAGQTPAVMQRLVRIYGTLNNGNIFEARSIRVAEAAKVIENAQRDINIAFINEVTMIFNRCGLSIHDVLDAAKTKWNFLPFMPGLVGGHCIGVDPFYLANLAETVKHHPAVILAGRHTNDSMGLYIADRLIEALSAPISRRARRVLVLGLTFKENVPDLRNSKVISIVERLRQHGLAVDVHDPWADPQEAREELQVEILPTLAGAGRYDAVIGAVPHDTFRHLTSDAIADLLEPEGLLADVKGIWRQIDLPAGYRRWNL